jgi:hypothetical protein
MTPSPQTQSENDESSVDTIVNSYKWMVILKLDLKLF